jgi:hypothetical protein
VRFAVATIVLLLFPSAAPGRPALSTISADRDSQRVGSFRVQSDPTMRGAVRAFGRPTSCRLTSAISSVATWNAHGLRISFATFGGIPPDRTACTYRAIRISWIRASGRRRWRTGVGLRPSDSFLDVKRRYPRARYDARPRQAWPTPSYWLVHYRERCVIGECPAPYHRVPKLIAVMRHGYVQSFFLPVGAQGD